MKKSLTGLIIGLVLACLSVPDGFQPFLFGLGFILILLSLWFLCIILAKEEMGGETDDRIE